MMRMIGISFVGVVMAGQLIFLFTRYIYEYEMRDFPRMSLPVAMQANRHHEEGPYDTFSWTQKRGWAVVGKGMVRDQDLDQLLRSSAERCKADGFIPVVRVRIPADAPAGIFVNLTKRMERAGVEAVGVVVLKQRLPRL